MKNIGPVPDVMRPTGVVEDLPLMCPQQQGPRVCLTHGIEVFSLEATSLPLRGGFVKPGEQNNNVNAGQVSPDCCCFPNILKTPRCI